MRVIITTLFKQYYTEFNRIINNFSCDILPTSKHRRSWERHGQRVPMESAVLEYPIMRKQTFSSFSAEVHSRVCLQPRCSQQFLRAHSPTGKFLSLSFCNRRRSKAEYLWRIAHGDAVSLYVCCALVFWQWSAQIVLASASKATGNISANNLWRRPPAIIWQRLRLQRISFIWSNDTLWMCSSLPKTLIAFFDFPCAYCSMTRATKFITY